MRKVLKSTNEVMHFWANKVQEEGKAGNVFFIGDKVYSYGHHFCIARHLPSGAVAFTTRKYSPTTSSHVSDARSAARHLPMVFCYNPDNSASDNMKAARNEINELLVKSGKPRIRQTTRDGLKAEALHTAEQANAYLAALPESEREHVRPIDTSDLEAVRAQLVEAEKAREKLAAEQRAARAVELVEKLNQWKAGELIHVGGLRELPPALRLNSERDTVQTSHGADIPVKAARVLWPVIQRTMRGKKEFIPGSPIGSYRLTKIRANGSIVVGCHDIAFTEIESIAKQLGI